MKIEHQKNKRQIEEKRRGRRKEKTREEKRKKGFWRWVHQQQACCALMSILVWIPSTHIKSQMCQCMHVIKVWGQNRDGKIPEVRCLASLTKWVSPKFTESSCLKIVMWKMIKKNTQHQLLPFKYMSYTYLHIWTQTYVCTHKKRREKRVGLDLTTVIQRLNQWTFIKKLWMLGMPAHVNNAFCPKEICKPV